VNLSRRKTIAHREATAQLRHAQWFRREAVKLAFAKKKENKIQK